MVKLFSSEKAVSSVIAVMLMIVVTVILAAAVSSYAGSMSSQEVAPQATLKASASYTDGNIKLEHLGGDMLSKAYMNIEIAQGTTSGYVNMTNVTFSPQAAYLRPGDMATIQFISRLDLSGNEIGHFTGKDIRLAVRVGTPFKVTVIDTESGQTIYSSTVVMNP